MSRRHIDYAESRLKHFVSWYGRTLARVLLLFFLFAAFVVAAGSVVMAWLTAGRLSWGQ